VWVWVGECEGVCVWVCGDGVYNARRRGSLEGLKWSNSSGRSLNFHFGRLDSDDDDDGDDDEEQSCDTAWRGSSVDGTTSDSVDSAKTGTGWGVTAIGVIPKTGELKLCARMDSDVNDGLALPVADEDEDARRLLAALFLW